MNTREELENYQDTLNEEELPCPKCGEISDWKMINEWGMCDKCFEKHFNFKKEREEIKKN